MKFTLYDTIWVAEDHRVGELIAATRHYDDMIDILCERGFITKDTESLDVIGHSLEQDFGDKWQEAIKKMSAKKLNSLFDWEITVRQVDLIEVK